MEWVTGRKSEISFSHDGKILTGKYTPPRRPISVPVTQLIGSPLLNTIIKAEDNSPKLLNVMIVKINIIMDDKKLEKTFLDYDRHLLVADVRRKESRKPNRQSKARARKQTSYR